MLITRFYYNNNDIKEIESLEPKEYIALLDLGGSTLSPMFSAKTWVENNTT